MAKDTIIVIRGHLNYAKVLGKARPHTGLPKYDKGPLWSVDVTPDAKSRKLLKQHGIEGKPKIKEPSPKDKKRFLTGKNDTYLSLKVLAKRSDGEANYPPKVSDARGGKWPEDALIGNGSVADLKIKVVDYGAGSEPGTYLQAIRVLDLVPYEGNDSGFEPLDEEDEYFASPEDDQDVTADDADEDEDEDLDDDVPF